MMRLPDLSRAATAAYRVLIAQQVQTLPVDPLFLLRQCRDTVVWTFGEAAERLSLTPGEFDRRFGASDAFTLCSDGRYIVIYREGGNPARQRFTLAHELGHRVLGHTGGDPADEREADCFASHLLCPRPVIARLTERFQPLYAEQLADAFYVSLRCAQMAAEATNEQIPADIWQQADDLLSMAAQQASPATSQNLRQPHSKKPERFWRR